jgi:hypothetical protein
MWAFHFSLFLTRQRGGFNVAEAAEQSGISIRRRFLIGFAGGQARAAIPAVRIAMKAEIVASLRERGTLSPLMVCSSSGISRAMYHLCALDASGRANVNPI